MKLAATLGKYSKQFLIVNLLYLKTLNSINCSIFTIHKDKFDSLFSYVICLKTIVTIVYLFYNLEGRLVHSWLRFK